MSNDTALHPHGILPTAIVVLGIVISATPAAVGQNGTWGVDADGHWGQASHWVGNTIASGSGNTAHFSRVITAGRTVTLDDVHTIGNLVFSDGGAAGSAWTFTGDTLILAGADPTITTITDATIRSELSGTNGFTKTGAGTLTLGGNPACSGVITLQSGTLRIESTSLGGAPPLGYWPMSEGSGATIANVVTGSPDGTLINHPAWVEGPGGPGSWGVQFNGLNQYGNIEPDAALHAVGSGPFTVSAWVKTAFTGDWYRSLVTKYGHTGIIPFWGLGWSAANQLGFVGRDTDGTRNQAHTGAQALDNRWHHLVGVREIDHTLRIYLDGEWFASVSGLTGSMTNDRPLQIAYHYNTFVPAAVAGVGVWDRALTAGEVAALHQHGYAPAMKPEDIAVRVAAAATLDLSGGQTIGSVADHDGAGGAVRLGENGLTTGGDDTSVTFSGTLSGSGGLTKTGAGTMTLAGDNRHTGDTAVEEGTLAVTGSLTADTRITVESGATLHLAATGTLRFKPTTFGAVNTVGAHGSATFSGAFEIDLAEASIIPGNTWTLVNSAGLSSPTYTAGSFRVLRFTEDPPGSGIWNRSEGDWHWTFNQADGTLTANPVVSPPTVENRPAVPYTSTSGSLRGEVTHTGYENPEITLFYGSADGGTNPAAWQSSISLGIARGPFSSFISGLAPGTPYYYRSRAANREGTAWAPDTAAFILPADGPSVLINEFMASNRSTIADEDGDYSDWIELHNPTNDTVDLSGWGLSDNPNDPFRWQFPQETIIPPLGYLFVWASGKDRPGTQASPAPHPDELDGLVLWLRADGGEFVNGQQVETWNDSSGFHNHATQSDPARRPRFIDNAINTLPVMRFNRSFEEQLFLPAAAFSGMADLSNFTLLTVARWTGGTISGLFGGYRGANLNNSGSSVLEIRSGAELRLRVGTGGNVLVPNALTPNQWHLLGASMHAAEATASLFIDGAWAGSAPGDPGATQLAQYERIPVGSSHDDARTFNGDIAEMLLYHRVLSTAERLGVERHLSQKYRLHTHPAVLHPHTSFSVAAAGEPLVLTRPHGATADQIGPVVSWRDVSYGRTVDDPTLWAFLHEATPGAANATPAYPDLLEGVRFSHASGFHHHAFDLALSHPDPDAVILYTLDGSEPDLNNLGGATYTYRNAYNHGPLLTHSYSSITYARPITVDDRSSQPNKLSLISSTSDGNPGYFPTAPVKKATVVRAKAYSHGAESAVSTATYFVSPTGQFHYSLPLVSLSLNEADLFDYYDGIYVAGVDHVTSTGGRICSYGNFNRRGRPAERTAHFQYFDRQNLVVDQGVGVRIHGNCSRRRPFKSMRLYARSEYDLSHLFDYGFLDPVVTSATRPDNRLYQRLVLRTPNLNDVAFSRLFQPVYEGIGGRMQPAIKFINGEYWGIVFVRDRFDQHHLAYHYGLDPDNVIQVNIKYGHEVGSSALRVFNLDAGIPSDLDLFYGMRDFIIHNNMSNDALYAQAQDLLCMKSFVDHLILKIFAGDDHYAPEYVFWRVREPENNGLGDSRWRVFVKDFDSTLQTANYVTGLATGTHPRPFGFELFQSLLANESFRHYFINRFADLINAHFHPDRFQAIIQESYDEVAPYWIELSERWNHAALSNPDRPFTPTHRQNLVNWSNQHPERQRQHIRQHFGIPGTVNLTVDLSAPPHGFVRVNTINLSPDTPGIGTLPYPWTGVYFSGIPVTLEAVPARGYRFAGWLMNGATEFHSTADTITLTFSADAEVKAVFDAANLPPVPTAALPEHIDLLEGGPPQILSIGSWFSDPEDDPLTFSATSLLPDLAVAAVVDGQLVLSGGQRGETLITVAATDDDYTTEATVRILIHPRAHDLASGAFAFGEWDADTPDRTYPPHMLFLQGSEDDSTLDTLLDRAYHIPPDDYHADDADTVGFPYNNTRRTRINGLGQDGIAFLNTGRGRDLGGALLALDTTGLDIARIGFTAGTVTPNSRVYALRLQYRLGTEGPFTDLLDSEGRPVEYVQNSSTGHNETLGPVNLPPASLDQPYLQLLWRYYLVSGSSGSRAQLRLDNLLVTAEAGTAPAAIVFDSAPTAAQSGEPLRPVAVRLLDAGGFTAVGFSGPVTIGLWGPGTLTGTLTVQASNGVAPFHDLVLTGTGAHHLTASAADLAPGVSPVFRALALTELIVPRFIQGEQDLEGDNYRRVPFAWQARLVGLAPNATYRYANRVVLDTDNPDSDGAGNMIFVTSATEDWIRTTQSPRFHAGDLGSRHYTFTAAGDGSFSGWFITEPSGNARFTPGNDLQLRLLLNDGDRGEETTHILTTTQSARVLPFGTGPGEGSGVMGDADAPARRLAVLYSDPAAATRPLAATPVEITGADTDERYVHFYHTLVATQQSRWGALIPNTLPGGLQRIEFRSATDGALLAARTEPSGFTGILDGAPASTVNPSGGTAPILLDMETGLPVFLAGGNASWNLADNWSLNTVPNGISQTAIINAPTGADRTVTLTAPVTIGILRVNQADTAFRNRFGSGTATLTFHGGPQPALLRVEGHGGDGFAEFNLDGGVHLATDVALLVNQTDGHPDYGALRLRQAWTGPGGLIKQGPGMASLNGGDKAFAGPIVIEQGVLQVTEPAVPSHTSGVTVYAGGQLRLNPTGSTAAPQVYGFGRGVVTLAGLGRGGNLPLGQQLGILGALRYEAGSAQVAEFATVTNPVKLTANAGVHVDGTRNTLTLGGTIQGDFDLVKTGGGTLVLAGHSTALPPAVDVQNGVVAVLGHHPATVNLAADGVLSGSGTVGDITGAGTVSLGSATLTAPSSGAERMAFLLTTPGGPSGNGTLALTSDTPLTASPTQLDLVLNHPAAQPGDRFAGGFLVATATDLATALASTEVRILVADPAGAITHLDQTYRVAEPADQLTWSVTDHAAGRTLEILQGGAPTRYDQWRNLFFHDPAERADDAIAGPNASPADDGITNLLRYALNVGPDDPVTGLLPWLAGETGSGLTYRFHHDPSKPDLVWIVRTSPDLEDWNTTLFDSREDTPPAPDAEGWIHLPVPDTELRFFLRLELFLI